MTCPVCGSPTVPGARFCFSCGATLTGDGAPPDVETERRVVTVLFGDLSDFTSWAEDLDPEQVGAVTDKVLATLAAIVTEHGGHVDKLVGDGIMAVFGAPTAHEDDAERAVRAAAKMQAAVRRLVAQESGGGRQLGLRVGLNTGEVLAGVQAQLSYTVIGDTVNTASRLSDAAGIGAVVAGRDTVLATLPIASWRPLEPLRLKGKRELVEAFELGGLRPAGAGRLGLGDDAPFLGRDAELALLVGRFQEVAHTREPRAVLVTGEAGVGKTRIAQEVSRRVGAMSASRVLWGRCAPYGEGRDLAAVAEMVRTACGVEESDDVATARARVRRTVERLDSPHDRVPAGTVAQLLLLLGLDDSVTASRFETAAPGPPAGGDKVRDAVAALFTALACEGPLLLVLDDLHWATPTLVDGLLHVASRIRGPALLLGLGRSDMLHIAGRPEWWLDVRTELVPLTPLEEHATERLLRVYLRSDEIDARARELVLDRAQGNPFFLAELLHLLIDRGVLKRHGDRWALEGELPPDVLPAGVQSVLAARIDDLNGASKGVLRDASVVGSRITLRSLCAVGRASGHGDEEVVAAAVRDLAERRLLDRCEDGTFEFAHTLVRDVAYAGLAKVDRARRHAAVACWAQQESARTSEGDLVSAGQGERAVHLAAEMALLPEDPAWAARATAFAALARLGQRALAREDSAEGATLLGRALHLADHVYGEAFSPTELAPVHLGRAQALSSLHQLDAADAALARVLELGDDELRDRARVVQGGVRRKSGDLAGARESFGAALANATTRGDERLVGEALRHLGLLDYLEGRLRDAEGRFEEAREIATRAGDLRGVGWALQHLAWSATTRGDYDRATAALEESEELFVNLEDTGGLTWVAGTEAFVRMLQGRFEEARAIASAVLPLGEQKGERWGVAAMLTIDAMAAAELGDVLVGADEAERARARFAEAGDAWGQSLALVAAGANARGAGMPDRAVAFLSQAVELSERGQHPVTAALALVALGYAHLDRGDLDGAEQCVWRTVQMLQGIDLEPAAVLGPRVLLAQVLRHRGQLTEALDELDSALSAAGDEPGLIFPRRQALAHRAGVLLELHRVDEALATARDAVASPAEDVRSEVLALRALGSAQRAAGDPEAAQVSLERALEIARSTGQVAEIRATEALLRG